MKKLTEELKQQYQNYNQEELNRAFTDACKNKDLKIVKYLLTSPDLQEHADIHSTNDLGFRWACEYSHLEIVQYLLTSPNFTENINIHAYYHYAFELACQNGNLDIVKYLLTSPDLKEHADIHAKEDMYFRWACRNGHFEIIQYLLTSPELIDHADIHAKNDDGFRLVCKFEKLEIILYLLSFNGEQCIDFQKTAYNIDWAIENQYHEIIFFMMKNLKQNNIFHYIECLPKIEEYSKELYEQVKNIEIESNEVNPLETSLLI